jgi:hypothetical protein
MQLELRFDPAQPNPESHPSGDSPVRLSRQCVAILERLRRGPATNIELSAIALRFTARIHELRAAGYQISILERDRDSGVVLYGLGGTR